MATELAQGYVSLSVGFDGKPARQIEEFLGQAQKATGRAGQEMGRALSSGVASGVEKAKANTASAQKAFEATEKAAQKASQSQENAARQVQIAEAKAAEARQRYAAGSSQVLVAEDRLERAKQRAAKADLDLVAAEKRRGDASDKVKAAVQEQAAAEKKSATESERSAGKIRTVFSKLGAKLSNPFRGLPADASEAGGKSGKKFTEGFKSHGPSFGAMFKASFLGNAASSAVTSSIGLIKRSLSSGFERLSSIDQATQTLQGLGNTGKQTAQIMDNALASVKGTAFGMGDAATVAASTVAAGIKPGQQLQHTLSLVADAASVTNSSLDDMGSIFSKVATSGKMQGDEIQQLSDRGIPIVSLLSKSLHKTSAEVYAMSSKGQINFAMFQKAMEQGVGGAAKSSGNTFTGAMDNVRAAIGRLGASMEEGAFKQAPGALKGLTSQIDNLGPAAEAAGAKVSAGFSSMLKFVQQVTDVWVGWWTGRGTDVETAWSEPLGEAAASIKLFLDKVKSAADGVIATFGPLALSAAKVAGMAAFGAVVAVVRALTPVMSALGKSLQEHPELWRTMAVSVGSFVLALKGMSIAKTAFGAVSGGIKAVGAAMSANPIGLAIAAVAALVAGFTYAYKHSEKFRNGVNGALNGVKDVALAVGRWFSGPFVNFFTGAWDGIKSGLSAFGNFFTGAWDGIKSDASATTNWFKGPFVNAFKSAWSGVKSGASATGGFFTSMWRGIQSLFTAGVEKIKAIWSTLKAVFAPVVSTAMNGVLTILRNLWSVLGGVLNVFIGLFTGNWSRMWQGLKGIVSGTLGAIRAIFQTFGAVMVALGRIFLTALGAVWRAAWNGMKASGIAIWNGIKAALSATWNGMKAAFGAVVHWFPTAWRAAWNAVKAAGIAIWKAIKAGFRAEINGWKNIFSAAINFFKTTWRAGWNWIKAVGAAIWNGITSGVRGFFNGVRSLFTRGINAIKWLWSGGWKSLLSTAMNLAGRIHDGIHDIFVNKIPAAFRSAVAAIKKAWDGLKNVAKAPVKFVVNTVLNGGLIAGFNWVAGKLGATKIDKIKLPQGFAGGGFVDLPWSAQNRDPYLGMSPQGVFRFEGEEFITNRAATRQSRRALEAINSGQLNDKILGFANGGFTGGRGHLTALAASRVRAAAQSLGWMFRLAQQGWNAANGLSGTSHAGDAVDVSGPAGGTRLWSIRDALRKQNWAAWVRGPAENFSWHVHAVPGPGAGTPRGSAVWQWSDYLAGGGGLHGSGTPDPYAKPSSGGSWMSQIGSAVSGLFGKFASPVDWLKNKFKSLGNVVSKFGKNSFTQMVAKVPAKLASAAISKVASLFSLSSGPSGSPGNLESWRPMVARALAASGIGGGKADEDKWLRQIKTESDGNPRLVQSSRVYDVNIARGDPARGLVQVPKVTWADFGRDMGPFMPNVYDPYKNLIVGMRAANAQHHNWRRVIGFGHGYQDGGTVPFSQVAALSEDGRPELVVGPQMRKLNARSQVFNAEDTAKFIASQGQGMPSVLVVRDVDDQLVGRMYVEGINAASDTIHDMRRRGVRV
ncbi:MAG: tape measure protein [Cutibacterium avidum]|uniref:tape measure protein n=1 Tax=Cutibacterium avidum TaxID=33010 RepID=UPI002095D816|nr:tape measure protein [Cutibacterium avidum]MCO6658688.1 tape measure protein [Cutibacterium avidum]MDU2314337.1 tape measure protein [Cutibacterium avidum]MDU2352088.1 tape measure protein [Cutibacterium avidum]MDU2365897.1 tape measure protein [Klebsiella michiganensis]